jgi:hypothetical protein
MLGTTHTAGADEMRGHRQTQIRRFGPRHKPGIGPVLSRTACENW